MTVSTKSNSGLPSILSVQSEGKKTYLYFNLPAYGHIYPTLDLVKKLTEEGHTVYYFSTPDFASCIRSAGACFVSLYDGGDSSINPAFLSPKKMMHQASLYYLHTIGYSMEISYSLAKKMASWKNKWNPDMILHDNCCLWGKLLANLWNIPAICTFSTMVFENALPPLSWIIHECKGALGIVKWIQYRILFYKTFPSLSFTFRDMVINEEPHNIIFSNPSIQPRIKKHKERFYFQDRTFSQRNSTDFILPCKKPFVYVSLGTIHSANYPLLQRIVSALYQNQAQAIVVAGNSLQRLYNPHPETIFFYSTVPQIAILKHCSLFIHHGGLNGTLESLHFGKPMMIIPQTLEQYFVGRQIKKMKKGILVPSNNPSIKQLKKSISSFVSSL